MLDSHFFEFKVLTFNGIVPSLKKHFCLLPILYILQQNTSDPQNDIEKNSKYQVFPTQYKKNLQKDLLVSSYRECVTLSLSSVKLAKHLNEILLMPTHDCSYMGNHSYIFIDI